MAKNKYAKQPLTFSEQLELIKSRGLIVKDEEKAKSLFSQISYFRLSAFFLPYQLEKDKFNTDVDFDQIVHTYSFDRELRLLVFDCIERIEIAIRTQMIYLMSRKYNNSHWQDDISLFKEPYQNQLGYTFDPYNELQKLIIKATRAKHPEVFIKHYVKEYSAPKNPPSWMCFELLTIGQLSRVYNGLKENKDKQLIANFFGLSHKVFTSWLHSLTYVRNICAHHSRLWNRDLAIEPMVLKKPKLAWVDKRFEINQRTFYFLCSLQYLLKSANPNNRFKQKLLELFLKYPTIPIQFMGIPSKDGILLKWENEPLWK